MVGEEGGGTLPAKLRIAELNRADSIYMTIIT